jgi:hypothetical protein
VLQARQAQFGFRGVRYVGLSGGGIQRKGGPFGFYFLHGDVGDPEIGGVEPFQDPCLVFVLFDEIHGQVHLERSLRRNDDPGGYHPVPKRAQLFVVELNGGRKEKGVAPGGLLPGFFRTQEIGAERVLVLPGLRIPLTREPFLRLG